MSRRAEALENWLLEPDDGADLPEAYSAGWAAAKADDADLLAACEMLRRVVGDNFLARYNDELATADAAIRKARETP